MGSRVVAPPNLTLALVGSDWPASRPGRYTPGEKTSYPFHRRLGGPRANLDPVECKKISCHWLESNPARSARRHADWDIPAQNLCVLQYVIQSLHTVSWSCFFSRDTFGLYQVDFSDPNRKRTAKKSALFFSEMIRRNQIPAEVLVKKSCL
jgi:hypothetical protein